MCILCLIGQNTERTKREAMIGVASRYNADDVSDKRGGCSANRFFFCCQSTDECFNTIDKCNAHCPPGRKH